MHEACDVTCGTATETYGTAVVCPFPHARLIARDFDEAIGEKGSRFQIEYTDPEGNVYVMGGLHCSWISESPEFLEGEIVARIGNNGIHSVKPEPTFVHPYDGAHLHLTLIFNRVVVPPYLYFNMSDPYRGPDEGSQYDMAPANWAVEKIKEFVAQLIATFGKR